MQMITTVLAQGGLSKRGLGSASIPKALNALGDDDSDEEDVESSPVERKVQSNVIVRGSAR